MKYGEILVALLHINTNKTKIVDFRLKSQLRTAFKFKCGSSELEVVPSYKYLGVWLDEHLDYQNCVIALSELARKALGLLIAKSMAIFLLKHSAHFMNH